VRTHPSRGHFVPAQPNGRFPRVRVHLTDTFRHLQPDAAAGVSGRRNEFLRALTATFDDPQAARVMAEYDHFATTAANAGFSSWFYLLWSSARLVPLVKPSANPVPEGADPDVRPVAVGETDLRAITSSMISDTLVQSSPQCSHLSSRQLVYRVVDPFWCTAFASPWSIIETSWS
jgi:hypothetical protein